MQNSGVSSDAHSDTGKRAPTKAERRKDPNSTRLSGRDLSRRICQGDSSDWAHCCRPDHERLIGGFFMTETGALKKVLCFAHRTRTKKVQRWIGFRKEGREELGGG